VPVLLRYGYKMESKHTFEEVQLIYNSPITEVLSGVIFHQWFDDKSRGEKDTGKAIFVIIPIQYEI
jgi:hypothetical protein